MEHRALRQYIVSINCADGGLVFDKFNHIAVNALLNLDKMHCAVILGFGITSYHKNFKNSSQSHKFTGKGI